MISLGLGLPSGLSCGGLCPFVPPKNKNPSVAKLSNNNPITAIVSSLVFSSVIDKSDCF